jgi:predicted acyltransferase
MTQSSQRFLPLDVFRGMTVCFMIIVNTGGTGGTYWPLDHASWHGWTPTDLVFPSFLFAVGNAMSFSMRKYQQLGNAAVLGKIFKRTLIIFLLGYFMYWFPFVRHADGGYAFKPFSHTRILGVLQRIALCYGIASLLIHYCSKKVVWGASILLLLGYWAIMWYCGTPGDQYGINGNAGILLDKMVMGDNHMYHGEGIAFDPEGILSTLPAIVNVIAGYYTGLFVQQHGRTKPGIMRMVLGGIVLLALAYAWNTVFPINKKLWTSSYVLLTVGIDLLLLSLLIFVIDILGFTKGTGFFTVFGKNPLFLYLLSEVLAILFYFCMVNGTSLYRWINEQVFQPLSPGKFGSLLFSLAFMLTCWIVGLVLDRKKIYIRV